MTVSIQQILQNNLPLGFSGSIGYTGSSSGFTGSQGFVGSAGPMGPPGQYAGMGYIGSKGELGFTGSSSGFTGSQGVGFTGSRGLDGYFAAIGYTGSSAAGFVGSIGGFNAVQGINFQTGTTYTIQSTDVGQLIELNNTATIIVTIPNDNDLTNVSVGQRIDLSMAGDGSIYVYGAAGVTLQLAAGINYLNLTNTMATLMKTQPNEWTFIGPAPSGFTGSAGSGYAGSQGQFGYSGSVGGFASVQVINYQTGTYYTLQSGDAGKLVEFNNTSTITVTIPNDNEQNFLIGQRIDIFQAGDGLVYVTPSLGVNFLTPDSNYLNVKNTGATLLKTNYNEWVFVAPQQAGYVGSQGTGYTGSIGVIGYAGSVGGFSSAQVINYQTSTLYTFQLSDAGKLVEFANSTTVTVTIPNDNDINFGIGQRIDVFQAGDGLVYFSPAIGVNFITPDSNYLNVKNTGGTLLKSNYNEWIFVAPQQAGYVGSQGAGYTGSIGVIGYAGSVGGFSSAQVINYQTSTLYTFQLSDAGKLVEFANTQTITVTIPNDNDVNFNIGQRIDVFQAGDGLVYFTPGLGVNFLTPDSNYLNVKNTGATLLKTNYNEWIFAAPQQAGYVGSQGAGYAGSIGVIGYSGSVGGFSSAQVINYQTSTLYTFQLSDAGKLVEFANTQTITVTIPNDNDANFSIGQRIDVFQASDGLVYFTPGLGVNFLTPDSNYLNVKNTGGTLLKTNYNEWIFIAPQQAGYVGSQGAGYTGSIGTLGYAGSVGSFSSIQTFNPITTSTYAISSADAGLIIECFNGDGTVIVIPNDNSFNPLNIGQRVDFLMAGLGPVTFYPTVGVTLLSPDPLGAYLNQTSTAGTLIKSGPNEYTWIGPAPTGFVGSRGFTGSQGDQGVQGYNGSRGYVGSTGIGYTGSFGYAGSTGFIGSTGVQGYTGSVGTVYLERHFNYPGPLYVATGSARWWSQANLGISRIRAQVNAAPLGGDINLAVKQNGNSVASLQIPAGLTTSTINIVNITTVDGDYITVDILSVGSSYSGSDLVVSFLYVRS